MFDTKATTGWHLIIQAKLIQDEHQRYVQFVTELYTDEPSFKLQ